MYFGITQEIDIEAGDKTEVISSLSRGLEQYLKNKNYGCDIQNFFVGCICIFPRPGYEDWFKPRKPRYKEVDRIKDLDGSIVELKGVYSYDIKMDFEQFVNTSDADSKKQLVTKLLESLSYLDKLPKKVKDFNKEQFKSDVIQFFKDNDLL